MRLTVILLTVFSSLFGQGTFDYYRDFKKILGQSQDSTSNYYYPILLDRFNKNDSTLKEIEVLALQIGFTANPHYKPYQNVSTEIKIKDLNRQKKYKDALAACNEFLKTNPVSFTALIEKAVAYKKLGKDSILFHQEKFMKILKSIMVSGLATKESPILVLSPLDEQIIIDQIWGRAIEKISSEKDSNGYLIDIIEIRGENEENEEYKNPLTVYFNINHAPDKKFNRRNLKKKENVLKDHTKTKKKK